MQHAGTAPCGRDPSGGGEGGERGRGEGSECLGSSPTSFRVREEGQGLRVGAAAIMVCCPVVPLHARPHTVRMLHVCTESARRIHPFTVCVCVCGYECVCTHCACVRAQGAPPPPVPVRPNPCGRGAHIPHTGEALTAQLRP